MNETRFIIDIVFSDGLPFKVQGYFEDEMLHLALALKQTDHVKSVKLVREGFVRSEMEL